LTRPAADDPRGALLGTAALAGALYASGITTQTPHMYYGAAVRSMSMSWHNFFYAAFDPDAIPASVRWATVIVAVACCLAAALARGTREEDSSGATLSADVLHIDTRGACHFRDREPRAEFPEFPLPCPTCRCRAPGRRGTC
jgi:hypothetical protein